MAKVMPLFVGQMPDREEPNAARYSSTNNAGYGLSVRSS